MAAGSSSDSFSIPKRTIRNVLLAVGAVVVLVVIVVLAIAAARSLSSGSSLPSDVNTNTYQAVFLSNSQIFFGKLTAAGGNYYELRHVFFLQSTPATKGQPGSQRLIPLTKEIHNPEDLMVISRSQVVYIENLNPAGRAAKLIKSSGG